jgi:hypothetical protein
MVKRFRIIKRMIYALILLCVLLSISCSNDEPATNFTNDNSSGSSTDLSAEEKKSLALLFNDTYSVRCVDTVVSFEGTALTGFGKEKSFGPPTGEGEFVGSLDVFVLGEGGQAVFAVSGYSLINGQGVDFKVFENGFHNKENPDLYAWDLGFVEVSPDQDHWYGFLPQFDGPPYDTKTPNKKNLAGLNSVSVNFLSNSMDPRLESAGGDAFNLENARLITDRADGNPLNYNYGNSLAQDGIMAIKYIKIMDGGTHLPDGQAFSNGMDIDAICFFFAEPDAGN